MSWSAFSAYKRETADIADATTYGMTLLMERAPDGPDVFDFLSVSAPVVVSSYAESAQGAALSYLGAAQKAAGYTPVLYKPATAAVTWAVLQPVVKWALTDVVMPWAVSEVLPKVVQGTTRLVLNTGRDTLTGAMDFLDEGSSWRRVPSAGACAWCRLLSVVSHTKDLPDSAYHGHCRCEPILAIADNGYDVPASVEDRWTEYEAQYWSGYEWARVEQRRIDGELWDRVKDQPSSLSSRKRQHSALRRAELPTLQQLTLSRMRSELGIH